MLEKLFILVLMALLIFIICFCLASVYRTKQLDEERARKQNEQKQIKGFINKLNHDDRIRQLGSRMPSSDLEVIFNRAKNPWRMTIPTFQFIRFCGLLAGIVLAIPLSLLDIYYSIFVIGLGILCFWYPLYYYKAIGNEREAEWNKMYEFVWVIKHNMMLYDPAKAYMNVKIYIENHAPHNKEIIQGFYDFYSHWNTEEIDPYITRFYPFSVTREITQIIFNMHKTGEFPEDSLNSLRSFIINAQNLTVEKTLSSVSGKATIFSLPFLMISVILALMVPLVMQIIQFL